MNLSISHLQQAYRDQQLTPRNLVEQILRRSADYAEHNIWIQQLSLQQIEPYLEYLQTKSVGDLPLYGVPFAIKDNIDLAGVPTTAACVEFSYTPDKSAFVVEQLIRAGAIPMGKTNMDQFATGLVGVRSPEPWGACKNAFNKDYISGGSSSGSSVAVALGLASFSLGTDTAGSGRVPASFNNLVGLKPSKGLLSMSGVVPACRSLDCVSIFALTTDDANAVLEQAAVYDVDDPYARAIPFDNNARHYGLPESTFSFAVPKADQLEFFANESARALFYQSVETMQSLGGIKQEIDFSLFLDAAKLLYDGPWVAERYVAIEGMMTQQPEALLPVIRSIIGSAENRTAMEVFRAEYQMQAYREQSKKVLREFDFLLTPTAGTIYSIDQVNADPIKLNSNLGYYTNYMNLLDCACVAVPAGFIENGLPWGISLVSSAMKDRKLLAYANRWQQALNLKPGKLAFDLPRTTAGNVSYEESISVIVCGAHLQGLPLNWQLSERGATLQHSGKTSASYRMYVLDGEMQRPGLVRDDEKGAAIEIEIWQMPSSEFGSFVAAIPGPLGIGKVEVSDGRWLPGFICEPCALTGAEEITQLGGWKAYMASK